ncbi:hypothetical protein E4U54_000524 [Claviceps lovelessii]|nr:hypothetical protein E4U54_000524 [Claviceps lovelessii]
MTSVCDTTAQVSQQFQPSKRALRRSCDRCHCQKLKCSTEKGPSGECIRCQRAGLRCVYSARTARQKQTQTEMQTQTHPRTVGTYHSGRQIRDLDMGLDTDNIMADDAALFCPDLLDSNDINDDDNYNLDGGYNNYSHNLNTLPLLDTWDLTCSSSASSRIELHKQDVLFPGLGAVSEYEFAQTQDTTLGEQQSYFDRLLEISQELEHLMHRKISPRRSQQCTYVFHSNPKPSRALSKRLKSFVVLDDIGSVFNTLRQLITCLEYTPSGLLGLSSLDMCLRTRTTMLAVHCHVLSVKIIGRLAKNLLDDIRAYKQGHVESTYADADANVNADANILSPTSNASSESNVDKMRQQQQQQQQPSTTASAYFSSFLHPDMAVNEALTPLDPLGHILASAIASLRAGISLLGQIQRALGISSDRRGVDDGAGFGADFGTGVGPSAILATSPTCLFINRSSVRRFLAALWDEDEEERSHEESGVGNDSDRTLHTLQVQYEEILGLFRDHFSGYSWHLLEGGPSISVKK